MDRFLEKNVIEIAPIAFMRGRTLNDSFVILDEAQNTTTEQMKMFVTRLGFNSKAVITGDITQIDLPNASRSGLIEAMTVLQERRTASRSSMFDETDVVRHHLVQRIIHAYEEHKVWKEQQLSLQLDMARGARRATAVGDDCAQSDERPLAFGEYRLAYNRRESFVLSPFPLMARRSARTLPLAFEGRRQTEYAICADRRLWSLLTKRRKT